MGALALIIAAAAILRCRARQRRRRYNEMVEDYGNCFPTNEPRYEDAYNGQTTRLSRISEMSETTTTRSISALRSSVRFSLPPPSGRASASNNVYRTSTSTRSPFADSSEFSDGQLSDPFSDANSVASSKTSAPSEHSSDTVSTRIHFTSEAAQSAVSSNRNSAYSANSAEFASSDSTSESLQFVIMPSRSSSAFSRYSAQLDSGAQPPSSSDQWQGPKSQIGRASCRESVSQLV